ncbi:unnamed protein product, partial [Rotaria sp. Silwood2]
MSLSKLESLPNEILTDIIEKYINGVDFLRAFSFQLNRRFDAIINQCQRLHFNFIQCQKDEFRFCMGLLPAYIDKIEELSISEQDTPGQVYAFLSFFPSFLLFKRLRKLYFHFNDEALDWKIAERALNSLSQTTIDTLSIKTSIKENIFLLTNIIISLFGLKSLKRFSLISNSNPMDWSDLANISSNIEHLTISGIHCELEDLQYILQCSPHLKYLDVEIVCTKFHYEKKEKRRKKNIIVMSTLHTLVLSFEQNSSIMMDMLTQYFNSMPVLKHVEIKAHSEIFNGNVWEMLVETSLPLLSHFSLRTTTSRISKADLQNVLASFQTSYWISKKNFNLIITEHQDENVNGFGINNMNCFIRDEFDWPVIQYWIAPNRTDNNDLMI